MSASSQIPRYEGPLLEGWEAAVHNSQVDHVDQETILTLSATVSQQPATWGLHSVSLCEPGAPSYVLDERGRLGTFSYVVNVGITTHM